jgi:hypothetical protein
MTTQKLKCINLFLTGNHDIQELSELKKLGNRWYGEIAIIPMEIVEIHFHVKSQFLFCEGPAGIL